MLYLIQTLVCWALFYLIYAALLRNTTFFRLNRLFIIGTACISLLIPALKISPGILGIAADGNLLSAIITGARQLIFVNLLEEIVVTAPAPDKFDWQWVLKWTWLFGVFVFSFRFLSQILKIQQLKKHARLTQKENTKLYVHKKAYCPFSFMGAVYMSEEDADSKNFSTIWTHEQEHIVQKHSREILFYEILSCVFWFNPFVWQFKKALHETHEFLVDDALIRKGMDSVKYQTQLFSYSTGIQIAGAQNFASTLKKRIIMICKKKSGALSVLRFVLIVPLVFILMTAFAVNINEKNMIKKTKQLPVVKDEIDRALDSMLNVEYNDFSLNE